MHDWEVILYKIFEGHFDESFVGSNGDINIYIMVFDIKEID